MNLQIFRTTTATVLLGLASSTAVASDGSLKTAGNVLTIGLPVVAAGISYTQDDFSGLYQLAKSEVFTVAAAEVLKHSVHETRPNGKDDRSFPSRHAAVSFAAAQYMQMRGGWKFGVPAYVAASLVGYSRVRAREHYWKDVAAGAALGIASSFYFTDSRERTQFTVFTTPKGAYAQVSASW